MIIIIVTKGGILMLVMFRFKNYGPFKEETVFDMRAIKSYKEHPYNLINENDNEALLKVVAIYGANASGKSNFIDAYRTYLDLVRCSFQRNDKEDSDPVLESHYYPFLLDLNSFDQDTEFEAVYHLDEYEYRYGFIYNTTCIEYEWLYRTSLTTKRQSKIFERSRNKIKLGSSVKKTCEKYLNDIDSDVLALSFFSSLKLRTRVFKEALYSITDILPFTFSCDGQADYMLDRYFEKDYNDEEKPRLLAFLKAIDVGIKDIKVEKNKSNIAVYTYHAGSDNELHQFPLEIESDGTKRAIAVYSLVRIAVLYGKGLMIDEFNNQLHPLLQKYIVDLFYEESTCGQLIYTTHDTSLLDKQFMRRDQVWFTSKNEIGESSLYSLSDFKIRNDKAFGKDYLGGVYGGIPILKDFSFKEE